ncbi:MAG: XRE family transcriptional regulator [Flavobacterium sp.]|nr:XRE family transcriptional regulator [Flavobacterium sp.]
MKLKKKFRFIVEKTDTGFSAFSADLPVFSTGSNMTQLQDNVLEALQFAYDETPTTISKEQIELEIDLKQFFQYYRVINAKYLAERIGMNQTLFSQYVKGHKKPSSKQTSRIIRGLHEIGRELSTLQFLN